ncbi:MAG TPA: cell division topological specificity factor MinE [Xanthobacteraceae bacterium]|nr:cell division topological specificity factor MinE [Xanthobacteraceae bacterium]
MNILDFMGFRFRRRRSAPVARERLQILLEYERRLTSQTDLLAVLRREIVAVVERHVVVDRNKVQVRVDRGKAVSRLEVGVEIPNAWRNGRERARASRR